MEEAWRWTILDLKLRLLLCEVCRLYGALWRSELFRLLKSELLVGKLHLVDLSVVGKGLVVLLDALLIRFFQY